MYGAQKLCPRTAESGRGSPLKTLPFCSLERRLSEGLGGASCNLKESVARDLRITGCALKAGAAACPMRVNTIF